MNNTDKFIPDPRMHRNISFAKSALRIAAATALTLQHFISAGILFGLAELLGVVEEIV